MNTALHRRIRAFVCVLLAFCLCATVAAQVAEVDFKSLYAAAEYDKALESLAALDTVEAQQYKALCLLALGRQTEADAAIEALVNASPTFVPSAEEVPPRFVELVSQARKELLPAIARRLFADGREQFNKKQNAEAVARFSLVLTLLADPAFEDAATQQDLKTLAQGFMDLARAADPPKPAPAPVAQAAAPPPAPEPVSPPKVTQPVALDQTVPPVPRDIAGRVGARLTLVVQIDATGKVTSVDVKESSHPLYDRLVVQAVRGWKYTPGTLNGKPIAAEQTVTIQTER